MKRFFLCGVFALLLSAGLSAQSFTLVFADEIPASAVQLLQPRMAQMLEAGGFSLADADADDTNNSTPLHVSAHVGKRVETPAGQIALEIELLAAVGEVQEIFPIKGVGDNEEDAWNRAVKQFLPRSKNAQKFVERLKQ